jgi:uncharacterized protein YeeX (DUF496 family)
MDSLRSWLGVGGVGGASAPPQNKYVKAISERSEQSVQERYAMQARKQQLDLNSMQEEFAEIDQALKDAIAIKDMATAGAKLKQKNGLKREMEEMSKRLANTKSKMQLQTAALSNLDEALTLQEGAVELQEVTSAMKEIDLHGAIDKMQASASLVQEHNKMLSEPIFNLSGVSNDVDDDLVQEELQALMAQQADADAMAMPDAPLEKQKNPNISNAVVQQK